MLSTRASRVANPGGKKLAREKSWIHAGKFAKQIELAFSYDVDWVGNREVIMDVFVLDLIFHNMVHVDSDDVANGWWCGRRKIFVGGVPH
jgi:hypothetical protein